MVRFFSALPVFALAAAASAYDAAGDFSTATNPNGVWSYGTQTTPGGTLALLTSQSDGPAFGAVGNQDTLRGWNGASNPGAGLTYPLVLKNLSANPYIIANNDGANSNVTVPANGLILHASSDAFSTIRFTAPAAGTYSVAGSFFREQTSNNVYSQRVRVSVAGASPFDMELTGNGATSAFSLPSVVLAAGGTIDFSTASESATGTASDANYFSGGSMGLNASVTPVPEPSALAALGLGALALLKRRKRA